MTLFNNHEYFDTLIDAPKTLIFRNDPTQKHT
jgi:hypothetical protein